MARVLLIDSRKISGGKNFRVRQYKNLQHENHRNMEALIAMGLISAGTGVVNKVVDTCKSTASSVNSSETASFNNVLTSEVEKTSNKYDGMTADELSTANADLKKQLLASPEIKAMIGNDKSFTIKMQGNNVMIQRADGTLWKVPNDCKAADTARQYCQCRSAQAKLDGSSKTGSSGWKVTVAEV
jgi:hypothetical protein